MAADFLTSAGLEKYRDGDEAFYLGAAVDEIRSFCGWHIAPLETVTQRVRCGERGIIMLRTLQLASVASVQVDGRVLDPSEYEPDPAGFITRRVPAWPRDPNVLVTYTHGYETLPRNVELIGYELVQRALDTVGGNTKDYGAGPYRVSLRSLGVELDDSQRTRLVQGGYALPGVR